MVRDDELQRERFPLRGEQGRYAQPRCLDCGDLVPHGGTNRLCDACAERQRYDHEKGVQPTDTLADPAVRESRRNTDHKYVEIPWPWTPEHDTVRVPVKKAKKR